MRLFAFMIFVANLVMKDLAQVPQLLFDLASFIVVLVVMSVVFYIAGLLVVGRKRALLSDAFVISLLGTIVSSVCNQFFDPLIGMALSFLVWLLLIKHYYETGWLGALAVAILAVIVMAVLTFLLASLVFLLAFFG